LDGVNLAPLILDVKTNWPERIIFSAMNNTSVRSQQFRLDYDGHLFDMVKDIGQTQDVADQHPEELKRLQDAKKVFEKEMWHKVNNRIEGIRPPPFFAVGYKEFPITILPARDGTNHGGVTRSGGAPNSSYFANWTSLDDRIVWSIDVNEAGRYQVDVDYTCPEHDQGSVLEVSFRGNSVTGKVVEAWDPPLNKGQDRIPRGGESYMKDFKTLPLGVMTLQKGTGQLTLRALDIPGETVADVRRITLTLLP
jgi:hypothetical protein